MSVRCRCGLRFRDRRQLLVVKMVPAPSLSMDPPSNHRPGTSRRARPRWPAACIRAVAWLSRSAGNFRPQPLKPKSRRTGTCPSRTVIGPKSRTQVSLSGTPMTVADTFAVASAARADAGSSAIISAFARCEIAAAIATTVARARARYGAQSLSAPGQASSTAPWRSHSAGKRRWSVVSVAGMDEEATRPGLGRQPWMFFSVALLACAPTRRCTSDRSQNRHHETRNT